MAKGTQALPTRADYERRWQLLEEAQRLSHAGTFLWDVTSGRLEWSDEVYRIWGVSLDTVPALELLFERVPEEDRRHLEQLAEEVARSGDDFDIEHRVMLPNGILRHIHTVGHGGRNSEGHLEFIGVVTDVTERKVAQDDLQDSKAKLEEAQRVAHVGYWEWNLETNENIWSNETCRIYGIEPQKGPIDIALIGEMIHPDDRELVFRAAEEAVRTQSRPEAEHRIVRPTGEIRVVHSLGEIKRDAAGNAIKMFGTVQDITDRKRAEEVLQQIQRHLSAGERLAHIGSWASSQLGNEWSDDMGLYWSDEIFNIYGMNPAEGPPTMDRYLAACHPQDRDALASTLRKMHEERCGCDITTRILRPDSEVRVVRCVGVPVFDAGVFKGLHGTTMDVTEHEALTSQLRREQAYLADAQGLTHTGSWAINFRTRKILHNSDENLRLYGFDPGQGDIPYVQFYAMIHPEDEPMLRAKLDLAISRGEDFDSEYRVVRTDGAVRHVRSIAHHNPSVEIGDYFGITADVTDRKLAEAERQRLQQLESELAHLNRVNMMGELAAALAHEIKQPIAASVTSANALMRWLAHDPPDIDRARATAARIEQDANRAANVIDSLRSFYQSGKPLGRQLLDITDIVTEMTSLLARDATRHAISIRADLKPDTPRVMANAVQLQQILMNLMLNAIDAMKESGGELMIRSFRSPDGALLVSISDSGVGLAPEAVDKVFEPFHTTKPQGTGMGLTITRSIVESYGGEIWACNNDNKGATFHVTLPVR